MWNFFKWLSKLYRKLVWVIKYLYTLLSPIYGELVAIIKQVKTEGLKDDVARKAVFQRITDFMQARGIKIPDSQLNAMIELVYQLVKNFRD